MEDCDLNVSCILGKPASGKTTALLRCACDACGPREKAAGGVEGAESADGAKGAKGTKGKALFVSASKRLAADAEAALAGCGASGVNVATTTELALEILAKAPTGNGARTPRLLGPKERKEVLDALGQVGTRGRRLRELTAFLLRGLSDMSDDDPSWLITAEEVAIMRTLRRELAAHDGYLACEVSAAAVRALRATPGLSSEFGYEIVLTDDFLSLGRASQLLVRELASSKLIIACDDAPNMNARLDDDYPCDDGLNELMEAYPAASVKRLEGSRCAPEVANAIDVLRDGGQLPGDAIAESGPISLQAAKSLAEEIALVANIVADALEEGVAPQGILVAGVNKIWRVNVSRALQMRFGGSLEAAKSIEVAHPSAAYGRKLDLIVFGGFVGGFIPNHGVCSGQTVGDGIRRAHDEDVRHICACLAAAERIVITAFDTCDLEAAERLDLSIDRIRYEDGKRIAHIKRSTYLP